MIELIKGEKRLIPMRVERRKKEDFKIDKVSCNVLSNEKVLLESGVGEINDSYKEVSYFLDTNKEYFIRNKSYIVRFNVEIVGLPKVIMGQQVVKIRK